MEIFLILIIPLLIIGLIRFMLLPMKLGWKLLANGVCGFLCLFLLNMISGFTGIQFPINLATVLIAGFLGLPGIVVLALIQLFL